MRYHRIGDDWMRYRLGLLLIRVGWWLIDENVRDEVIRLLGIAGRKEII